jgi:sporulation protein YlmC with PRC-barrel domain
MAKGERVVLKVIEACSLRNDGVKTSDGRKVGAVVNVIFGANSKSSSAWLLVFPFEESWIVEHLRNNWGGIAIDSIKMLLPEKLNEIDAEIASKGTDAAEKTWRKYIEDNYEKFEMRFKMAYFIPASQIDELRSTDGHIVLKCDWNYIGDKCRFIGEPSLRKNMAPLFESINKPVRNLKKLLPVTLNLSPVFFNYCVSDSEDEEGYIDDLQLDLHTDVVSGLIVQKDGANSGRYLVPPKDFDFTEMRATKPFAEFEKLDT